MINLEERILFPRTIVSQFLLQDTSPSSPKTFDWLKWAQWIYEPQISVSVWVSASIQKSALSDNHGVPSG